MNKLKTFNHSMFGDLPVLIIDDENYFGATNVASSLEYKQPHTAVTNHCDKDGVITYNVIDNLGRKQQKKFITLGNVSRLIVAASKQSKNTEIQQKAKVYEKWVFDDVIPSVHKNGGYIATTEDDDDQSIMAKALLIANKTIERKQKEIESSQRVIEQQRPKVLFAELIETSHTSILVRELAKLLKQNGVDFGEKRLFAWLRENGYLIKRPGTDYNMPTQRSMDLGLFEIKETPVPRSSGITTISKTPKVTGKGQLYFLNKLAGKERAV